MEYKKDYFGYVYEWTNMKNNMKYIGSHYGSVQDCYIGSGKKFRPAYDKNPKEFSLKILEYVDIDDKKLILAKEQNWLDKIDNIKCNPNFYNLSNNALGGSTFITQEHINKRSKTLKEKHQKQGLSEAEKNSYKIKIDNRLKRISTHGFTEKEKQQHLKYGCTVQVITPNNEIKIYNSFKSASKDLGIDILYGNTVCKKKSNFRGYKIKVLKRPRISCSKNKFKDNIK